MLICVTKLAPDKGPVIIICIYFVHMVATVVEDITSMLILNCILLFSIDVILMY